MNLKTITTTTYEKLQSNRQLNFVALSEIASESKNSIVDGPFGSSLKTSDYVSDGIPVLQGKNITGDKFSFFDVRFITPEKSQKLIRSKTVVGDILIIKIGSIGYAAEIDNLNGYPYAIIPANLAKITLDEKKSDKRYILQWLKTDAVKKYFQNIASKTAQPALSLTKIKGLPVFLPPLAEQQHIAAILDVAEIIVQKCEQSIAKLDELARNIFEGKFNTKKKEKNWTEENLGDVCHFVRGPFGGALKKEIFTREGFAVYEQQHAIYNQFNKIRYFINQRKFEELKRFELKHGDLIMSCSGTMGKVAIVPHALKKGIINQALLKLTPNKNLDKIYLKFYMESNFFQQSLKNETHGAAIKNVASVAILKKIKILIPPLVEQQKFSNFLKNKELIKTQQIQLLNKSRNLILSLQHQSFAVN